MKKIMASLFEKFDIKGEFMEIQKNLHLIKITDLQNLSRTKGRGGGGAVKKFMSLKTN